MNDLKCSAVECVFNDCKCCTADKVKIEHDTSCQTYSKDSDGSGTACHCE